MTAANMRARRCVFSYHVTSLALKKKKKDGGEVGCCFSFPQAFSR